MSSDTIAGMEKTLRFQFQCGLDWETMPGDDASRWCNACNKDIPNLSAMRAEEQLTWLGRPDRPRCVRALTGPDGWVATAGGAPLLRIDRPLPRLATTLTLAAAAAAASALAPSGPPSAGIQAPPVQALDVAELLQELTFMGYIDWPG